VQVPGKGVYPTLGGNVALELRRQALADVIAAEEQRLKRRSIDHWIEEMSENVVKQRAWVKKRADKMLAKNEAGGVQKE
jgi:hypothetical protein